MKLSRYENSNAELPQVLNSHNEEIRIQQSKYKQLKQQYRELTQRMKEKDMQLQQLRDEHQHLLDLSKDRFGIRLHMNVTFICCNINSILYFFL